MKRLIFFFAIVAIASASFAQGVKVGDTPGNPDSSSMFEVESTDKGFLPPRMTNSQRDDIVSPADGLVIFNTSTNCLNFRVAGFWQEVCGNCIPQPTKANAGFDQFNLGNTSITLSANSPVLGNGSWAIVNGDGGTLESATNPSSVFTGIPGVSYVLRWTITNECGNSEDDLNITFANPAPGNQTFSYTGASQSFTVPLGVTSIQIEVWGAQGGTTGEITGGLGGYTKGDLTVTSGQSLSLYVGGEGALPDGGFNGGGTGGMSGGGGASDVRTGTDLSDRVIVAGGGGGSTYYDSFGGSGGGANGGDAPISTVYECSGPENVVYGIGGGGGTQSEGGAAGSYYAPNNGGNEGVAGTLGIGAGTDNWNNGGGGGGYYGGGSGGTPGCSGWGAGGGGGSSYTGGVANGTTTPGIRSGNGLITITW